MPGSIRVFVVFVVGVFLIVGSHGCTSQEPEKPSNPEFKVPDIPPSPGSGGKETGKKLPMKK
jgi:hypothetical protein